MIRLVKWKHGEQVDATGQLVEIAFQNSLSKFVGLILRPNGTFHQAAMEDLVVTASGEGMEAIVQTPAPAAPKPGSLLARKPGQ